MTSSGRMEVDMLLNAKGVAEGANDAKAALSDLESAVGDVASESGKAGDKVDSFADKVAKAAREAGKSDDDIKDALKGYGVNAKEAERAIENIGDEFKDAGRDGERAMALLEDDLKDVQKQSKRTEDSIGDIGDKSKKSFDKASDGAKDFKQEAEQSAKEAAASFDGSAESIADMFQEVAANAFSGFGPAGAIAGLAAAAGIGLAVAGFEDVNEQTEESRQRAAEWAQAYVDAGGRVLSAAATAAKAIDIATDADKYKQASENATNWGVDVSVAIAAMAGQTWALEAANDSLSESERKIADEMSEVGIQYDWTGEKMSELGSKTGAGREALNLLNGEMELGSQQAINLSESLRRTAAETEGATSKVDEFGDTITTLPDGTVIYIDAETGQATIDVDAIEQKIYSVPDSHSTTFNATATTQDAWNEVNNFIASNDGRSFSLRGRVTVDSGAPFE